MIAQQGHRYQHGPHDVLALSSGERPRVATIHRSHLWPLSESYEVDAVDLQPLPMAYFHGQVPEISHK